jgi:hypothetical protein
MTSYNNIPIFDDCDREDFLVWRELLLSHFDAHHPKTAQLLRMDVFDKLAQIGGNVGVDERVEGSTSDDAEAEAVLAAVIGQDEQAEMRNRAARGHIILFLGPIQRGHCCICRAVWKYGPSFTPDTCSGKTNEAQRCSGSTNFSSQRQPKQKWPCVIVSMVSACS